MRRDVGLLAIGAMCFLALPGEALAHVNGITLTVNRGASGLTFVDSSARTGSWQYNLTAVD